MEPDPTPVPPDTRAPLPEPPLEEELRDIVRCYRALVGYDERPALQPEPTQ